MYICIQNIRKDRIGIARIRENILNRLLRTNLTLTPILPAYLLPYSSLLVILLLHYPLHLPASRYSVVSP